MTDAEIIAPGKLLFDRGWVNVHEIRDGQVYFAARANAWSDFDLRRMDIALFLVAVRREGDVRRAE